MEKEYLKGVYNYLEDQYADYNTSNSSKQKSMIETRVRSYSRGFDDELYLILNEGSASGLFEHGFFNSDLSRSLRILKDLIGE